MSCLQTVFEEIEGKISQNQPDVVRLVDCNRRKPESSNQQGNNKDFENASEAKYRNDENVLMSLPAQYRPIETGEEFPPGEYVTDAGKVFLCTNNSNINIYEQISIWD